MFNFMKKTSDKDDKDRRKRDKKDRKEKQKRDRASMSAEELLRLDEVRKSLKLTRRRKEKEKLPSGITADYTENFLANLEKFENPHKTEICFQSDSSETSLNSRVAPKPPKRGILKSPKVSVSPENGFPSKNNLLVVTSPSPSADSLTDTTNSSFATPPFSLSPVGESQGFNRWSSSSENAFHNLSLPPIVPIDLPRPRILTVKRQKAPRNDFGFSLRRTMVVERSPGGVRTVRAVVFAEPGNGTTNPGNETGLLPGDKLLEVNGVKVGDRSREEIIEMIRASGEAVVLKVQPVAELSEITRRWGCDGSEVFLEEGNIRGGTLKRSGSRRYRDSMRIKTDEEISNEKDFLETDKVWLAHKGGFASARRLSDSEAGKARVRLDQTGEVLSVDDEDIEKANPDHFDRCEDITSLRYLNESSLLHTLRQRYGSGLIHTYAGAGNLLVVNPMTPLGIYSEKIVALFKGCKTEDMPPHVYSIIQSAYESMIQTRKDQSVVFLGRAGSGKTTNFRHSLQYLVTAAGAGTRGILTSEKLSAIFCILENFGNSRSNLNSNTTKFLEIFNLDFDQTGSITSGNIRIPIIEKTRLIKKNDSETNFHIINKLLNGSDSELKKELKFDFEDSSSKFFDFRAPRDDRVRVQSDFSKVLHAFQILGVKPAEVRSLWAVLAAIFHLSNAGVARVATGGGLKLQFGNPRAAQRAADLLGTSVEELSRLVFGGSGGNNGPRNSFRTPSPNEKEGRREEEAVLEEVMVALYGCAFGAVVGLINKSISSPSHHSIASILLVDSPGFQNPATCGKQTGATFEDFCHNYVQERLQYLFHDVNLIAPRDRYLRENVDLDIEDNEIPMDDPGLLPSLLDNGLGDRKGLFFLLDEENSNGDDFVDKIFESYKERDHQLVLRKSGSGSNQFIIQHFHGTNPVLYDTSDWSKSNQENPNLSKSISILLRESEREEISRLFSEVSLFGANTSAFGGSIIGLESTHSLRRASSVRRTLRKSVCVRVKFAMDAVAETLRRTRPRFVYCLLPRHDAGNCDANNGFVDGNLNVPLLRSQIRGAQVLPSARLHKQGFPCSLPLAEFRRRFALLAADAGTRVPKGPEDERDAVQELAFAIDLEPSNYRLGLTQIFFRNGVLPRLESRRDERLAGTVVALQARCRGFLARRALARRKLQDVAVRCVQRNVRKFLLVRDWPWWRLLVRVTPLLDVHRTEQELRLKTEELQLLKSKLEKVETERNNLRNHNEKLEAKLSEMTADLAEEHSTSTLASERLESETSERQRLERELSEAQKKNRDLKSQSEKLEMELLYARSDSLNTNSLDDDEEDPENSDGAVYKQRYERALRELEFTKRRLRQQHEDDLEQLVGLKKQLEKKLSDAYEEVEEQRNVVNQWKRKVGKLNGEMSDIKLLLEEESSRNNILEKKQRKFDTETNLIHEELKKEKFSKDKLFREKELLVAEKFNFETKIDDLKMELDSKSDKIEALQKELEELTFGGKTEEEFAVLRKQKIDYERRLNEQEEELDELAGQVQLLEQSKLKLEMNLEQQRKISKKDTQQHEEEIEEIRSNFQKKLKNLEMQLENEHEERTAILKEKHEVERKLSSLLENDRKDKGIEEALVHRLKRDLKRTKALLRDTQMQLDRQKSENPSKSLIRHLRNQIDDLELSRASINKSKQSLEIDLSETQSQLEETQKNKSDLTDRLNLTLKQNSELQTQIEETEEELQEILKKYKIVVQQMSLDQNALREQVALVSELETERAALREQVAELSAKLEAVESAGDASSSALVRRGEMRAKELEHRLELEKTTRQRLEVQVARAREAADKAQAELAAARAREHAGQEQVRRLQRNVRELKEEHNAAVTKEGESILKRKELEKRHEALEAETATVRADLRLALKRIEDLQAVIQNDLEDSSDTHSDSEIDSLSSEDSTKPRPMTTNVDVLRDSSYA